ncbi:MAG: glycosyltransferase [Bacteroidetes bacterium]|nr:glycosyltransferase [Bacteroidota bacterium]
MKILFAQNAQGIGGSENYLLRLLPALQERGHEVAFAGVHNTKAPGSIAEVDRWMQGFRDQQIPVFFRTTRSYLDPTVPWWLWKQFRRGAAQQKPFDLLHTHLIYADFWAACIRAFVGKRCPVVSTVHGYEERILERYVLEPEQVPRNLYWQVFNATRRFLPLTYSCSAGLRDFYARAGIRGAHTWPVVEHGFDFPGVRPPYDPNCRLGNPQIAVIGRLIKRKGVPMALEAIEKLLPHFPGIQLVVVGSGPELEALRMHAADLGLSNHVHFQGFDPNPIRWMLASDLVLVPSYAEGLPLVIFEAFFAQKPVVAFDTIGCRDLIQNGETGILAPSFERQALVNAIRSLLADKSKSIPIVQSAHHRLFEYYTLKRMVDQTASIYRQLLPESNPSGSMTTLTKNP